MAVKGADDEWIFDKELVKTHFVDYFKTLFTEEGNGDIFAVPHDVFQELPLRDWELLKRPFSTAEIDHVVKHMKALKAPGPDGFQALFY